MDRAPGLCRSTTAICKSYVLHRTPLRALFYISYWVGQLKVRAPEYAWRLSKARGCNENRGCLGRKYDDRDDSEEGRHFRVSVQCLK